MIHIKRNTKDTNIMQLEESKHPNIRSNLSFIKIGSKEVYKKRQVEEKVPEVNVYLIFSA